MGGTFQKRKPESESLGFGYNPSSPEEVKGSNTDITRLRVKSRSVKWRERDLPPNFKGQL